MQTEVERIKNELANQFNRTVRPSPAAVGKTEFKVNAPYLINSDLTLIKNLIEDSCCDVEVKRSGTGLVVIVTY